MRTLITCPTDVGVFEICQTTDRKYHVVYDEESLGSYSKVQEAVDALVDNKIAAVYHMETKELVDTSKLDIPRDYTHWESVY